MDGTPAFFINGRMLNGNLTYENAGSGIMLDRSSTKNLVYANSTFGNVQDGVTIYESSCNAVQGNLIHNNDRDGVKIRNSWNVSVQLPEPAGVEWKSLP